MTRRPALAMAAVLALAAGAVALQPETRRRAFGPEERTLIASLGLHALSPPPPSPSNRVADDERAARFGRQLFFDEGLSANGAVSCASCHQPEAAFADPRPRSVGMGVTQRHAPALIASAWSPWQTWDGRRDTLRAQALVPLESPSEQGITRTAVAHRVAERWRDEYEAIFGALPSLDDGARFPAAAGPLGSASERRAWDAMSPADQDAVNRVFASVGKAIAAYERRLRPAPGRFDAFARALARGEPEPRGVLDEREREGLALFIGKGNCASCHFGPLLSSHQFHATGLKPSSGPLDLGRSEGVIAALTDPFNCLGPHSDASPEQCAELRFAKTAGDELVGAMKVPTLRALAVTAPYMHDGSLATLADVIEHYDVAPQPVLGHSDLVPLGLTAREKEALAAFLLTLGAGAIDPLAPAPAPDRGDRSR